MGTHPGCPLFPLVFALAIEPLARAIITNANIKGYQKGEGEFKLSLYADDVLMFLPDPIVSLPNLLNTLKSFHAFSWLGVNLAKCLPLPINIPSHISSSLKDTFGFSLSNNTLQYLGVRLSPSLWAMYNANYPQAFNKVKQWLRLWSSFHISLLGRVTAIKMSILPLQSPSPLRVPSNLSSDPTRHQ